MIITHSFLYIICTHYHFHVLNMNILKKKKKKIVYNELNKRQNMDSSDKPIVMNFFYVKCMWFEVYISLSLPNYLQIKKWKWIKDKK